MKKPTTYFVIYQKTSTRLICHHYGAHGIINHADVIKFDSFKSAQDYLNKNLDPKNYKVSEYTAFKKEIEINIVRTNTMTGKTFKEPINTPLCLSPSSDTYWSM